MATTGERPARLRAVGGWLKASPKTRIGGGAAGLALAVSGLFGGLDAEAQPAPAPLEARQVVHAAPFDITVKKLATIDDLAPGVSPDDPADRLFVISIKVRNTDDKPAYAHLLGDAFGVKGGGIVPWKGQSYPRGRVIDFDDSTSFSELSPGITYDVLVVYEQKAGWTERDVDLSVFGYTYQVDDPLALATPMWTDSHEVASGTFPVDVIPKADS